MLTSSQESRLVKCGPVSEAVLEHHVRCGKAAMPSCIVSVRGGEGSIQSTEKSKRKIWPWRHVRRIDKGPRDLGAVSLSG